MPPSVPRIICKSLPQIALDVRGLAEIADPADGGPISELFVLMAETIMLALGPS